MTWYGKAWFFVLSILLLFACEPDSKDPYVRAISRFRYSKDSFLKLSNQSPMSPGDQKKFVQLNYFGVDSNYKVTASWEKASDTVTFKDNFGGDYPLIRVGWLSFRLNDQPLSLAAYSLTDNLNEGYLWVPFKDNTNDSLTHKQGRFLEIESPTSAKVELDFNYASNPPYIYDQNIRSPLPPDIHKVNADINAGELRYGDF